MTIEFAKGMEVTVKLALTTLVLPHLSMLLLWPAAPSRHLVCETGRFVGTVAFRGDQWPIRLHLVQEEDRLHAAIDLPELVMAGETAAVRCSGSTVILQLPFGFGEVQLQPVDRGFLGTAMVAGDPLTVRLSRGGAPPYTVEDITFGNEVRLAGQLYVPRGIGPFPGVVLVHGSGPQGIATWSYRSWADIFARQGIAVLAYDKRGVGASGGAFEADSAFVQLTADALAAVNRMRRTARIDSTRVGLSGGSQAGWIAFKAAAKEPTVGFLVLWSVPAVSVADQEIQRIRAGMQADSFAADAIDEAVAHTRLLMSYVVAGVGWDAVVESTRRVALEPWSDWVQRPDTPQDLNWWRTHATVDPGPEIAGLRIPVLVVASMEDLVVPAAANAGALRLLLDDAEADGTVLVLKRGDHRIELPTGRNVSGSWQFPRINPEMLTGLRRWLLTHVLGS